MTQTCDLVKGPEKIAKVKNKKIETETVQRFPKVPFINIALLEPFERLVLGTIERHGQLGDVLMVADLGGEEGIQLVFCSDKIYTPESIKEILNTFNNDHKHIFFIAISKNDGSMSLKGVDLSKLFPIRVEHYDLIAKQVEYQLKDEFANALGWKLAELYGRVGLPVYTVDNIITIEAAFRKSLDEMFLKAKRASIENFKKIKHSYTEGRLDRVKDLLSKPLE